MKHLKIHKSKFSESKSYPVLKSTFLKSLPKNLSPSEKREALKGFEEGFVALKTELLDWYEGMPPFLDPEYRIHPLMGHQVRSRHRFEPEGQTQEQRAAEKVHIPIRKPKVTPYQLNPSYRDKGEKEHSEGDLHGVKQYPVILESEQVFPKPSFDHIKSVRLRRSVELLELKIGYDHQTNRHVLYSPLKYSERWDRQSQAIWLRTIGMSPKRIGIKLSIKYDTIKNWLRVLKDRPLVPATQQDWAVRQVDGHAQLSTPFSSTEAKPRSMEVI